MPNIQKDCDNMVCALQVRVGLRVEAGTHTGDA